MFSSLMPLWRSRSLKKARSYCLLSPGISATRRSSAVLVLAKLAVIAMDILASRLLRANPGMGTFFPVAQTTMSYSSEHSNTKIFYK